VSTLVPTRATKATMALLLLSISAPCLMAQFWLFTLMAITRFKAAMKIQVTITDDHGFTLHNAVVPIQDLEGRDGYQWIDFPSPNCDLTTEATFCTPRPIRDHVTKHRAVLSELIASELMHFFESKDTTMGYPKNPIFQRGESS